MSLTQLPDDTVPKEVVCCAICHKDIPLDKATAGFVGADDRQAFACDSHFYEGNRYITGWIDFTARERLRALNDGEELGDLRDIGADNAWSIS